MADVKARELQYEYKAVCYLFCTPAWLCVCEERGSCALVSTN